MSQTRSVAGNHNADERYPPLVLAVGTTPTVVRETFDLSESVDTV